MVSTQQKAVFSALATTDVATQTELPQKHAAIQVSGCRECRSLSLVAQYNRYEALDMEGQSRDDVDESPSTPELRAATVEGTDRPSLLIHGSVAGVTSTILGFFDNGMAYTAPGLLASDGIHLSQRGKKHTGYTPAQFYGDEPVTPEVIANRETPVKYLKGIKRCSSKKVTQPTAQMKCLYTNGCNMGNKQEEWQATVLLESYDLIAIAETWWDKSHDWSGCRWLQAVQKGQARKEGQRYCPLHQEMDKCEDLSLKNSHDQVESFWGKNEMHRQWKQGEVSWEEYRDAAPLCRDGIRKAKAQLELNLAGDAKNNKKGFYRYVSQKRKVKESVPPQSARLANW
ncbi:hypothetical protein QYF61_000022 [Mycteria americana]|uniref:Uncharacterized protein n=1 Tax=Mycteria americana TaxID=33587 RepID=A0AAN7NG11_MYCAM|nr:hypothetical protein QYF61_000022 [Mycteria americana]